MNDFVLDASVALTWCFHDEANAKTTALLEQLENNTAFVPSLFRLEIGNILLGAQRKNRITYAEMIKCVSLLVSLNIQTDNETSTHAFHETLLLSYSQKLTTYDAAYLELAIRLNLPLATRDKELVNAAKKLGVKIL